MKRFLILLAAMAIVLPACTNDNNETTTKTISAEEVKATVTEFLNAGETSFSVDFTPGTQAEMHTVVISLISEAKTEGAIISSDLSTSSVTYTLHATFADAHAAWEDNTTLTLLANAEYNDKEIDILNKAVILDLNGKELKTTNSPLFNIGKKDYNFIDGEIVSTVTPGEMTIRDSGENGAITTSNIFGAVIGTFTLENGTLNNTIVVDYGTFNMTGGKIIMPNYAPAVDNWGTANISGGILSGPNCIWTTSGSVTNISGNPTIKGTDFDSLNKNMAIYVAADATVTISGTPTLIGGSKGEIFVCNPITLNTQPTDGKWRISINTDTITVFATPGEDIDLDASKFESALEGYEVQKLDDGSLAMIKITE